MDKTLSFAAVHFVVAFLVGYLMTGSVWVGGALALVEPACNTVAFHLHEKAWKRIERRRTAGGRPREAVQDTAWRTSAHSAPGKGEKVRNLSSRPRSDLCAPRHSLLVNGKKQRWAAPEAPA